MTQCPDVQMIRFNTQIIDHRFSNLVLRRILVGDEAERPCVRLLEQIPGFVGAVDWNEDLDAAESINGNPVRHPKGFAAHLRGDAVRLEKRAHLSFGELTLDRGHGNELFHDAVLSHLSATE
jgi:hypothetical protein